MTRVSRRLRRLFRKFDAEGLALHAASGEMTGAVDEAVQGGAEGARRAGVVAAKASHPHLGSAGVSSSAKPFRPSSRPAINSGKCGLK